MVSAHRLPKNTDCSRYCASDFLITRTYRRRADEARPVEIQVHACMHAPHGSSDGVKWIVGWGGPAPRFIPGEAKESKLARA
jgi:hypothetical protein